MKKITKSYWEKEKENLAKYVKTFKKKNSEILKNVYPEKLVVLFERYLEVYGHAYCMDLKRERKKTAKLLYKALMELNK